MHLMECCRSPKHVAEVRALQSQLHCVEGRNSSGDRTSSVHVGKTRFCFERKLGRNPRGRPPVDSEQEIGSHFGSAATSAFRDIIRSWSGFNVWRQASHQTIHAASSNGGVAAARRTWITSQSAGGQGSPCELQRPQPSACRVADLHH